MLCCRCYHDAVAHLAADKRTLKIEDQTVHTTLKFELLRQAAQGDAGAEACFRRRKNRGGYAAKAAA